MKAFAAAAHTAVFIPRFSLTGRKTRAILSSLEAHMFYYTALAARVLSSAVNGSPRAEARWQTTAFLISDT